MILLLLQRPLEWLAAALTDKRYVRCRPDQMVTCVLWNRHAFEVVRLVVSFRLIVVMNNLGQMSVLSPEHQTMLITITTSVLFPRIIRRSNDQFVGAISHYPNINRTQRYYLRMVLQAGFGPATSGSSRQRSTSVATEARFPKADSNSRPRCQKPVCYRYIIREYGSGARVRTKISCSRDRRPTS